MIKAMVRCTVCEKQIAEVEAETSEQMLMIKLPSLLIACHAATPHCPHELSYEFEGMPTQGQTERKPLKIQCLFPACVKAQKIMETTVPKELVTAIVIVFHTAHEGHPMEIVYDGDTWRSPPPLKAKGTTR